jgi:pyruvate formate lyase activating enzyme
VSNPRGTPTTVYHRRRRGTIVGPWSALILAPGETYRFNLAKATPDEIGPDIALPEGVRTNLHEVFDRAHYPTVSVEEAGVSTGDVTPPMPLVQIQPTPLRASHAARMSSADSPRV